MRNKQIRSLVFASMIIAIIAVLTFTQWGFINLGTFAFITIIHIPVLIGAIVLGPKYGALFGAVFGISSLILASMLLGINAPFTNPLLSVLPRILFGWIIYYIWFFFKRFVKKDVWTITLTMITSTFLHSLVVIFLLYVIGKSGFYFTAAENPFTTNQNIIAFLIGIFSLNSLIEIALSILIGTPVSMALMKVINRPNDAIES